jgi:hypothetical protein
VLNRDVPHHHRKGRTGSSGTRAGGNRDGIPNTRCACAH